jgi:hypothetical protein
MGAAGNDQTRREAIKAELEAGTCQLVIGTHSLLERRVTFRRLGLAVIDEQHKFGVDQVGGCLRVGIQLESHCSSPYPDPARISPPRFFPFLSSGARRKALEITHHHHHRTSEQTPKIPMDGYRHGRR